MMRETPQVDSTFRISLTDPWIWKDQYRTSRTVYLNNTTSSGNAVHGKPPQTTGTGVQRASVLDAGESQVRTPLRISPVRHPAFQV